jgi:hypothetical protein
MHLTDTLCKKIEPPAKGNKISYDNEVAGLGVRVTAAGTAMDEQTTEKSVVSGYLREDELAKQLHHHERTLARWRAAGKGPPYTLIGREVWYEIEGTRKWLAAGGVAAHARSLRRTRSRR